MSCAGSHVDEYRMSATQSLHSRSWILNQNNAALHPLPLSIRTSEELNPCSYMTPGLRSVTSAFHQTVAFRFSLFVSSTVALASTTNHQFLVSRAKEVMCRKKNAAWHTLHRDALYKLVNLILRPPHPHDHA